MRLKRKCYICRKPVTDTESGCIVGLRCVHSEKCYDKLIDEVVKEVQAKRNKAQKKISEKELTQRACNKYIRTRDTPHGIGFCISCGGPILRNNKSTHAGHFKTVGARDDLRYNEDNINGQCQQCNNFGNSETGARYKDNLIKKIGIDRVEALNKRKTVKYTDKMLKELRKYFNEKTREILKKEQSTLTISK